ncbi:class I SAM-dependent methyltransferase [Nannocystis bainbridge]|uniref:Class I SAM-dependent methyltransferase n=1 Tax=Nannocystis bainbridge TaxID=2995303 RepID=A0ABT5DZE6_9BACT|nr:class I SAM-dependent methyltransferase [Nannocystis bainbridge]MDC0719006.1 class I SAM-dependent methyltransferase [Nannocystis bainbridge]
MKTTDVVRGYDLWASTYDRIDNPLVAMTAVAMRRWHPTGRRVLELGCGTGRNAPFLLERGFEAYVGVDVSPGMLAEAARRVPDPRARFVERDAAEALELGDFDGALLSLVLEHAEDVAPLLASAARAVRSGGWLHIFEIHPRWRADGGRAHFQHEGEDLFLPSYLHDVAAIQAAMGDDWTLVSATDWYADPAASAKLARRRGQPVLLEVTAVRA